MRDGVVDSIMGSWRVIFGMVQDPGSAASSSIAITLIKRAAWRAPTGRSEQTGDGSRMQPRISGSADRPRWANWRTAITPARAEIEQLTPIDCVGVTAIALAVAMQCIGPWWHKFYRVNNRRRIDRVSQRHRPRVRAHSRKNKPSAFVV